MAQRVRLKLGDNEIEVEGDEKFVDAQLRKFLEKLGPHLHKVPPTDLPSKIIASTKTQKAGTPAEYYRQKMPQGGTETLLVLAKFLEDFRSQTEFTRKDINKLAAEAKLKDVHAQYFTLAVKQGLLRAGEKGKYALSISGEDAVLAMPAGPKVKT